MLSTNPKMPLFGYLPILFWILIIATSLLLLTEVTTSKNVFPHFDKIVHASIFTMLSGVGYLAYIKHRLLTYYFLAVYGGLTELLQGAFTITRHASVLDWMADLFGILLWLSFIYLFNKYTSFRTND